MYHIIPYQTCKKLRDELKFHLLISSHVSFVEMSVIEYSGGMGGLIVVRSAYMYLLCKIMKKTCGTHLDRRWEQVRWV